MRIAYINVDKKFCKKIYLRLSDSSNTNERTLNTLC